MAMKKPNPFGQRKGGEVITGVPIGGAGGGARGGFGNSGRGGIMGRKTSGEAKAAQSGSNLAKNYRAGGQASGSISNKNAGFLKKTFGW